MNARPIGCAAFAVAALLAAAADAPAQTGEPVYDIQSFKLMDWGGELFMESKYREDSDDRANGLHTSQSDLYLESGVELNGRGYAYHPNLVDWSAVLRIGFSMQDTQIDAGNQSSDGKLIGYDLSALLLKAKPVSFRVFGNMTDQFVSRTFAQALDFNRRSEGFEVYGRYPIDLNLLVEHTVLAETSDGRAEDEETLLVRFTADDRRDDRRSTQLVLEHEDADQQLRFSGGGATTVIDLPLVRDDLTITNDWKFGPEDRPHTLIGTTRFNEQTGFLESQFYFANQQLTLRHTPTFSTFYTGRISHTRSGTVTDDGVFGEVGLRKQFYKSLSVTARAYVQDQQYDSGSESRYGGSLDADYRKKTPVGLYRSQLELRREQREESFEGGTQRVIDEPITLNGVTWERLTQPNAVAGSVAVTDITNTFPYVLGADYMLRTTGAFTEIRRIAGGAIADGETVLVDYTADRSESASWHRDRVVWSHRMELADLPVVAYTRVWIDRDTLDSGVDPGDLEDEFGLLFGAELDLNPLLFVAEYEMVDLQLSPPFTSYRVRAAYIDNLGAAMTLNTGAHYEMTQYQDVVQFGLGNEPDFLESMGVFAELTGKPRPDLLLRVQARIEQTHGRDESLLARIEPALTWRKGLMEVDLRAYHELYEQDNDSGVSDGVEIKITRRF